MNVDSTPLLSDVPEHLNDLVPYRCPKCGHLRKFATLRELRLHLQSDHAFQMGYIKPNQQVSRSNVFQDDSHKTCNVKTQNTLLNRAFGMQNSFNWSSKTPSDGSSQLYTDHWNTRDGSPLLESFKAETEALERELQMAKQNELKNKARSMNNLTGSKVNEDFKQLLTDINNGPDSGHSIKLTPPVPRFDLKGTLEAMNSEVMKSRLNHWVTSDALYKSQDVLNEMEQAAEDKCKEQRDIIQNLLTEVQNKDRHLEETTREHSKLNLERTRLFDETENIVREADSYNQRLQEELKRRGDVVESISSELETLRRQSEMAIRSKENDLQSVKEKMNRLEWERDRMVADMEKLLQRADTDSRELRNTMQDKEKQLHKVNAELNDLRSNQQKLLEKTMEVYKKAEESQEMMKTVIVAKDDQLQSALGRIEQMKGMQRQIVEESRALTDQADENTASLKRLLQMKQDQITEAMKQLQFLRKEKSQLEDSSLSLAENATASVAAVENLKSIVREKEKDLKNAQGELKNLKTYLHSVADKERAARAKLEKFIEDLISRAETAEAELHALRSHSSDTAANLKTNTAKRSNNHQAVPDTDFSAEEISERQSLPKSIPPPKPPRSKNKLKTSMKSTPEWRQHLKMEQIDVLDAKKSPTRDTSYKELKPLQDKTQKMNPLTSTDKRLLKGSLYRKTDHGDNMAQSGTLVNYHPHFVQTFSGLDIGQNFKMEDNSVNSDNYRIYEQMRTNSNKNGTLMSDRSRAKSSKISQSVAQYPDASDEFVNTHKRPLHKIHVSTRTNNDAVRRELDRTDMLRYNSQKPQSYTDDDTDQVLRELNNIPYPHQSNIITGNGRSMPERARQNDSHQYLDESPNCVNFNAQEQQRGSSSRRSRNFEWKDPDHYNRRGNRHQLSYSGEEQSISGEPDHDMHLQKYIIPDVSFTSHKHRRSKFVANDFEEENVSQVTRYRKSSGRKSRHEDIFPEPADIDTDGSYELVPASHRIRYINANENDNTEMFNARDEDEFIYVPKHRPGTIGMSRDSPKEIQRNKKKHKSRRKARLLNPDFDSNYPLVHRSMVNLQSRPDNRSLKADRRSRSRRSKSLSPAARVTENDTPSEHESGHLQAESTQKPSRKCVIKFKGSSVSDLESVSDGYVELREEESDKGDFDKIMDENGILWGDDTLPDVSDSEFDRVSPSGSEAIGTKKICQTGIKVDSVSTSKCNNVERTRTKENKSSENDDTKQLLSEYSSQKEIASTNKVSKGSKYGEMVPKRKSTTETKALVKPVKVVRDSSRERKINNSNDNKESDHSYPRSKTFRPIKSEPKYSSSDKEMTSGGKEVDMHMRRSPVVNVHGLTESTSPNISSKHLSSASKSSVFNDSTSVNKRNDDETLIQSSAREQTVFDESDIKNKRENLDETLKRITEKYKSKRDMVSKSETNSKSNRINEKVKSISDKYSKRRQDIVAGKGVSPQKLSPATNKIYSLNISGHSNENPIGAQKSGEHLMRSGNNKMFQQQMSSKSQISEMHVHAKAPNGQIVADPTVNDTRHHSFENQMYYNQTHDMTLPTYPGMIAGQMRYPVPPYYTHPGMPFQRGNMLQHRAEHQHYKRTAEFPYIFPYFHPYSPPFDTMDDNGATQDNPHKTDAVQKTLKTTENASVSEHIGNSDCKREREISESTGMLNEANRPQTGSPVVISVNDSAKADIAHIQLRDKPQDDTDIDSNLSVAIKEPHIEVNNSLPVQNSKQFARDMKSDLHETLIGLTPVESTEHLDSVPTEQFVYSNTEENDIDIKSDICHQVSVIPDTPKHEISQEITDFLSDNEERNENSDFELTGGIVSDVDHVAEISEQLLDATGDTDSHNSISEGFSMFAEPIVNLEDASFEVESNAQSLLEVSESISGEFDVDADTESLRRELYDRSEKIKELIETSQSDYSDVYKMKSTRNTMSSASSQVSFDIPDRIPWSRREEVKGRRQALRCIFSFLDTPTLCRAAQVCREWRIVSRSPKLWRRVELRNEKISSKFLLHVARRCSELKVLIFEDIRPRNRKRTETLEEYQENIQCSLETGYEHILKKSESSLHTISIVNCGTLLSAKCLWAASCYSRMLKHVIYLSDFDPINAEVMWALGSGCRDLKTLKVHPLNPCQRPGNFSTRCVQLIGKCFPDLEKLSLGNADVEVKSLVYIAKQCRKLKYLDLDHMSFVPADVIDDMCDAGLRYLTCIRFTGTMVAPEGLVLLQDHCHYLDCIYVQMTVNDYFKGTSQKEDLKLYNTEMNKIEELLKTPGLSNILRLKIAQVPVTSGDTDKEQAAAEEESSSVADFFKKILPF